MAIKRPIQLAIALTLLATMPCQGQAIADTWATQGYSARVRIAPCADDPERLCGAIVWLWDPRDDTGAAKVDLRNPERSLRRTPLLGLNVLSGFRAVDATHWTDGRIYDPETGRTFQASLRLKSPEVREVSGCVLFFCQTQTWRRADSLCAQPRP